MQVLTSSETQEWYTPPYIIDAVREVIGPISLDPASHEIPQKWIRADSYFTLADNGLEQRWTGIATGRAVFLNPPYGKTGQRSNQEIWTDYMISQLFWIRACIVLTRTVPGYYWWDDLFNGKWPGPLCITRGRIGFVDCNGEINGLSKAASSFWYHGPDPEKFYDVFSKIGRVLQCP